MPPQTNKPILDTLWEASEQDCMFILKDEDFDRICSEFGQSEEEVHEQMINSNEYTFTRFTSVGWQVFKIKP